MPDVQRGSTLTPSKKASSSCEKMPYLNFAIPTWADGVSDRLGAQLVSTFGHVALEKEEA